MCGCVGVCVFCRTRATEALKIARRWMLFGWVCVCVFVWAGVWIFNRRGIERWPQELVKEDAEAGLGSKRDDELSREDEEEVLDVWFLRASVCRDVLEEGER